MRAAGPNPGNERNSMKYFAVDNAYSTETSMGFSNTWMVLVFLSRKDRDDFVSNSKDLGTKAIKRSEIGEYLEKPKPFSGKAWVLAYNPGPNEQDRFQVIVGDPERDGEKLNK